MAINKIINKSTKTHGAMRNCIEYVLGEAKIREDLMAMTGPSPDVINWDTVYKSFLEEKRLWNKDRGRMYQHSIISFHADEKITPETAFAFAKEFVERWFSGFQTLFAVHMDRDHVHIHMVTNTVSYIDGKKLHTTRHDLEQMKQMTNQMCRERGLSVAEKGHHFDGTKIEPGTVIGWSKDKYHLLLNESKKSFVAECGLAFIQAVQDCASREEFIERMKEKGWHTRWDDRHKHITFENENGQKVRDTNLSKTFNINIEKEALIHEFNRQNEERRKREAKQQQREQEERELREYYASIESAIADADAAIETAGNNGEITGSIIREAELGIESATAKEKDSRASRSDRDAERRRLSAAREREAKEKEQGPERTGGTSQSRSLELDIEL